MATLLRLIGLAACLIMVASFIPFVKEQGEGGTQTQLRKLGDHEAQAEPVPSTEKHGDVRKKIDEWNKFLAKPFAWITKNSNSEWLKHIVTLVLGLLLYGVGLFALARALPTKKPEDPSTWKT